MAQGALDSTAAAAAAAVGRRHTHRYHTDITQISHSCAHRYHTAVHTEILTRARADGSRHIAEQGHIQVGSGLTVYVPIAEAAKEALGVGWVHTGRRLQREKRPGRNARCF